jgi:hypothetical protein
LKVLLCRRSAPSATSSQSGPGRCLGSWVLGAGCCLAVLGGCRIPPTPSFDTAAAEYVRLARAGARPDAEYLQALASARADVSNLEERDGRRAFLLAQLAALERRARFLAGESATVREEAARSGMPAPVYDAARAIELREQLEAALPGAGSLQARLEAYRRSRGVGRAQLDATAKRLVDDCRAQTPSPGDMRDGRVELRYVLGQPWPAFTTYRGAGVSLVEIRRDVAWNEDDLRAVLCHETYPGHHVQHLVWDELRQGRGWVEFAVMPSFTPHALMAERAAVAATNLLWPPADRPPVERILSGLAPLAAAVAVDVVDGRLERAAGLARLQNELLMPNAHEFVAFVEQYRSMTLAYVTPVPDVRDWQGYLELLRSPERLVAGARQ